MSEQWIADLQPIVVVTNRPLRKKHTEDVEIRLVLVAE
jgi:hypothetical protein